MAEDIALNLRTPVGDLCKEELNKIRMGGIKGTLFEEFRDERPDVSWEAEQLAKSHGIYLEFNRAKTGSEKDWMYMLRVAIPGGGVISREQWRVLDELSEKYTVGPAAMPSFRLTTRQAIQFHWVGKHQLLDFIRTAGEAGLFTLNGCGDNVRNIMACPLSRFSRDFNAYEWAVKTARHFRLPEDPYLQIFAIDPHYLRTEGEEPAERFSYGPGLLNRKFKIAFATALRNETSGRLEPDNCVEMLTNDMGIAPVIENDRVTAFQIYVGGGQGEKAGKPTLARLAEPLGIVGEAQLLPAMSAVVATHQEWGDRQNRHWARLKYVIKVQGIDWFRARVEERLGFKLEAARPTLDFGARDLHHGWSRQEGSDLYTFGAFIENGRVHDTPSTGRLKTMVREIVEKYPVELMITANQDLLFQNIPADAREEFQRDLQVYGFGARNGAPYSTLRRLSGACVGRDTCRLTYTDSEKFEPFLIDELEKLGWGEMRESIGITGCERQCFRPATKTIGLVGSGLNRYQLKLFGSEDGRHQGTPLLSADGSLMYLRTLPRDKVATLIDVLFRFYVENRLGSESMGDYHRRIGAAAIIAHLQAHAATSELMAKPFKVTGG